MRRFSIGMTNGAGGAGGGDGGGGMMIAFKIGKAAVRFEVEPDVTPGDPLVRLSTDTWESDDPNEIGASQCELMPSWAARALAYQLLAAAEIVDSCSK